MFCSWLSSGHNVHGMLFKTFNILKKSGGKCVELRCRNAKRLQSIIADPEHFYRRELPSCCIGFGSVEGKRIFKEAINSDYMNCFFNLAAQFKTQEEPDYCGLSTLVMVLNALSIDPGKVWKSPWRWYHEKMLEPSIPLSVKPLDGLTLLQFYCLAKWNGLDVDMVQMTDFVSVDVFRNAVKRTAQSENEVLVTTYARETLGQTGSGHFSPVGGYHAGSDMVLIFDVARFKYPPHWITVELLWEAMRCVDKQTGQPRGYMIVKQTKSTGNLTALFKMSRNFDLALNSQLKPEHLEFLENWLAWLGTVPECEEMFEKREYIKKFVLKFINLWHSENISEYDQLLNLRVNVNKYYGQLSEEQKCMICQLLDSLTRLSLFHYVEECLNPDRVQETSSRYHSCCQSEELKSTFPEIKPSHFVTMILLSWPYEMQRRVENSNEITHAELIPLYLSEEMSNAGQILQSEVHLLKIQLSTMFSCYQAQCRDSL